MRTSFAYLALLALAGGCGTYRVNRSALAPRPTPAMHSGHPLDGVVELAGGLSSVSHLTEPSVGNPDSGVEVAGTQVRGDVRIRASDTFAIGFLYESGLDSSAAQPRDDLAPVDEGNVSGYGVTAEGSIPTSNPQLRIGLVLDLMMWRVPWVEWRTCIENCLPGEGFTYEDSGIESVSGLGLGVVPSYRVGSVTYFAGINARSHPDIEQKGVEMPGENFEGGDVKPGPLNVTLSAGAEMSFGPLKGSLIAYQTVTRDPVQYGPGIAALLTIPIGRPDPPPPPLAAPAAPAPPPGPYAPPPDPYAPPPPAY